MAPSARATSGPFYYNRAAWKNRRKNQLLLHPLCKFCLDKGIKEFAIVADHVVPHRGDVNLFFLGELQSLCIPCHNRVKQNQERREGRTMIGIDGWPVPYTPVVDPDDEDDCYE